MLREDSIAEWEEYCNRWSHWGPEDAPRGATNFITPDVRSEAARTVTVGRSISLSRVIDAIPGIRNPVPATLFTKAGRDCAIDYLGLVCHGMTTTHVDAFCHVFWKGKIWGGGSRDQVDSGGARAGSIDALKDGIVTRGVLVDIPRLRGERFVAPGHPVTDQDILDACAQQGVELRSGDGLLVYSGRDAFEREHPVPLGAGDLRPGVSITATRVLKEREISILGWDMLDASTTIPEFREHPRSGGPVHVLSLVYLGVPLIDNMFLEGLARACAEVGKWEFLLSVAPLVIPKATGSAVNPLAIL